MLFFLNLSVVFPAAQSCSQVCRNPSCLNVVFSLDPDWFHPDWSQVWLNVSFITVNCYSRWFTGRGKNIRKPTLVNSFKGEAYHCPNIAPWWALKTSNHARIFNFQPENSLKTILLITCFCPAATWDLVKLLVCDPQTELPAVEMSFHLLSTSSLLR